MQVPHMIIALNKFHGKSFEFNNRRWQWRAYDPEQKAWCKNNVLKSPIPIVQWAQKSANNTFVWMLIQHNLYYTVFGKLRSQADLYNYHIGRLILEWLEWYISRYDLYSWLYKSVGLGYWVRLMFRLHLVGARTHKPPALSLISGPRKSHRSYLLAHSGGTNNYNRINILRMIYIYKYPPNAVKTFEMSCWNLAYLVHTRFRRW